MYKTRQEQAYAELVKKQKAERKNAPKSYEQLTREVDRFIINRLKAIAKGN